MDNIEKREITQELRDSYLDYAMSVIVSRALPDVRDGLKPVQRRILYTMHELGLTSTAKFRKCAKISGDTTGNYHPHGTVAVYDALARMAQDFSLRYPLIIGQGNFGCFTKDTKVKLTDGRALAFEDLVKEYGADKTNYTYTVNKLGLIAIAKIEHPRITKTDATLVKVVLDNGEEIRCTPNHRFMLRDGLYREAQYLAAGDSLMPLYEKFSEKTDRLHRNGYVLIHQPKSGEWIPAHHLSDNYNLTNKTYAKSAGRVRHHVNFDKLNNNPDNIARLAWGEHWKLHYEHAAAQHTRSDYRQKIAEGRKNYWADPAHRAKHAMLLSSRNIANWKKPEYREHMRKFLSDVNTQYIAAHPEMKAAFSARMTKTLGRLWQNPEYRLLMHQRIIKGNKNHTTNKTGKLKFLNICKEVVRQYAVLNEENYIKARSIIYPYGSAPLWLTGLSKYFQSNADLVRQEISNNHKVLRVERLREQEDVYDLTIEGTHNFCLAAGVFVHNSVDGDPPAAERYTEAKLSKIADELLTDIDKETVDWQQNYDGVRMEPKYFPAKLPNMLLNGAVGIAVGMATNIPPHNLTEVVDATLHTIDNPDATAEDLMNFVKGPDFPTGGIIYDRKAITAAYIAGRGAMTIRALAEVKERKGGKAEQYNIEITEIPYQVNKSELIIKMAELVTEKKIDGIRDIRDESDKDGMSIIIELKNDVPPQKVLNQLYQYTDLQKDFHLNLLALADGLQPRVMSIKDVIAAYIAHRKNMVRRRAEFDLRKAEERAHILTGLVKALDDIDAVISTIKKSEDRAAAHANLMKKFKFSEIQANAILEMRLQTLAALEREKLDAELKEKKALIAELQILLKSAAKILGVIKKELGELREKYGDERRTKVVVGGLKEFRQEDLVPQEDVVITLSHGGYIKRVLPEAFKSQHRGGKGLIGSDVAEEDFLQHFISANTHDNMLFFTDRGRVFQTKAYEIPEGSRTSKGKSVHNFLEISPEEKISAVISYSQTVADKARINAENPRPRESASTPRESAFLVMATKNGMVKKTALTDFGNVRRTGIIAIRLKKGDELNWVMLSSGGDELLITTANGQGIRFKESQTRPMSRTASGVRGIRLKGTDHVSGLEIVKKETKDARLLTVMANGYGKQTKVSEYKIQNRGGSGVRAAKITAKTGPLISAHLVSDETELLVLSAKGQIIRTSLESVRQAGRATQGVRIMSLNAGDHLIGVICL